MPAPAAEAHHATRVQTLLHQRGAAHLRVRKRGVAVIVESGRTTGPVHHFRLRRDTVHLWRLDMATHTGRWEPTPFRAQLDELVAMVVEAFPWTLTPIQ
jgi:hypothetical protein